MPNHLLDRAARIGDLLVRRRETVAVAESSSGGLIASALLAAPGASRFFMGGAVIYTGTARAALLGLTPDLLAGIRPATELYASALAGAAQARLGTTWALGEIGAAGPTGNRYGDPAGTCCFAVHGPVVRAAALATNQTDRWANMQAFAEAALDLFEAVLRTEDVTS